MIRDKEMAIGSWRSSERGKSRCRQGEVKYGQRQETERYVRERKRD